jgi:hypothetical protein
MRFVLVNDRAARASTCAHCSRSIGLGYLREMQSKRLYCGHACYRGHRAKFVPSVSRFGSGIDGLPIGGVGWSQLGIWA